MIDIKAVQKSIRMLIADQVRALSADKADDPCAAAHRGEIRAYQHVLYILAALKDGEERAKTIRAEAHGAKGQELEKAGLKNPFGEESTCQNTA